MMVRIDMLHLGFDTINRYAIGQGNNDKIQQCHACDINDVYARRHTEISSMRLSLRSDGKAASDKWNDLYNKLLQLNGYK